MLSAHIASLPKAELHLHLEGSIRPAVAVALSAQHGISMAEEQVRQRYNYADFAGFIDAFKWVTSLLREPRDYALIAQDLAEQLISQNVVYAEVTLSVGIMLLRRQQVDANFEAILAATTPYLARGLRMNWIVDAVRQFGPQPAMQVVDAARRVNHKSIVAFGIGGDELSVPTAEFREVYDRAAEYGFRRLIHAGETGGPEKIREAIEILGVDRVGHGIAAIHDAALMDVLAARQIPLEICPTSNVCTGALARQLARPHPALRDHPLAKLFRHGIPVLLSTDDPAMFHTTLSAEYEHAQEMGFTEDELSRLVDLSFKYSFNAS
jgi:adenosine deaminase/aminodeoxyfutalosine deaminase